MVEVRERQAAGVAIDTKKLRRAMAERGWSAGDLARTAGLSANTMTEALRGRPVAPGTLRKIVAAITSTPPLQGVETIL
jgi:lambda repressor-like predicted transcriptional regulator